MFILYVLLKIFFRRYSKYIYSYLNVDEKIKHLFVGVLFADK